MGPVNSNKNVALVACEVIKPELESAITGCSGLRTFYLRQSLHRTPKSMPGMIQEIIDQITGTVQRIVLGYGLCSNGIVGVTARREEIIVPRCHDCISFFLGSPQSYLEDFRSRPGSYYLTPGWILEGKDPLHIMTDEYYPRYGEETSEWAMKEELKHYTHIVLIDTGHTDIRPLRSIGRENASYFGLEYLEIPGKSLEFFNSLIKGPYDDETFIVLKPGEQVEQNLFL